MNFKTYLIIALTLATLGAAGYGAFYAMDQSKRLSPDQNDSALEQLPPESLVPATTVATSSPDPSPLPLTDSSVEKPIPSPVVVYEAEGSFTQVEKDELTARYINPYKDYYRDNTYSGYLLTITISPNPHPSSDEYPYLLKAIFDSGAYQGASISISGGTGATPAAKLQSGGHIDWWVPECMVACTFSDAFKASYPEIVAKSSGQP